MSLHEHLPQERTVVSLVQPQGLLHITIMTTFKDKVIIVGEAMKVLYNISGFAMKSSKLSDLGMIFAQKFWKSHCDVSFTC